MAIKWKSIKYSNVTKLIAVFLLWLSMMSFIGSNIYLAYYNSYQNSNTFYETNKFKNEFGRLVYDVIESNVVLKSPKNVKASVLDQSNMKAKLQRFDSLQQVLTQHINFVYYLKNTSDKTIITNVDATNPLDFLNKQTAPAHITEFKIPNDLPMANDIQKMLAGTPYELTVAVLHDLKPGDSFYAIYSIFKHFKEYQDYAIALMVISIILFFIMSGYLIWVTGRRSNDKLVFLMEIDRVYTDLQTLGLFIFAVLSLRIVSGTAPWNNKLDFIFVSIFLGVDLMIGINYVLSMLRQFKKGQLVTNTLLYRSYKKLKDLIQMSINGQLFKGWIILLLLAYGLINGLLFSSANQSSEADISLILILLFNILSVFLLAKFLTSLASIMEAAKEISCGNLEYTLEPSKISNAFVSFAHNIMSIQGGLKNAVQDAVKGEKMKTDLITNVSHDLKTPLTSIVNYVDLLKKEQLANENAQNYLNILEEKSMRLKVLIDDLVEASKASSGNIVVNRERMDLHQLIMQACGEYEEKISLAELELKLNTSNEKVIIDADGKYMWRIVENLLSNVIKYSMKRTRVYIDITTRDHLGVLTIKNVSSYPLDIPPEQLTERFVRGDAARTSEGSGLGLSIAQSLALAQQGNFNIKIDGDLFKVSVEIPLWKDNKELESKPVDRVPRTAQ